MTLSMPRRLGWLALAALCLAGGLAALDGGVDGFDSPADFALDVLDRLLPIGAAAAIACLAARFAVLSDETEGLRRSLGLVSAEAEAWRMRSRRLLDGLSAAVSAQFRDWGLTPAEAEIAGLMLKGAALRDIAVLRHTSEATIRQQAQGIYRKSGLANRAELAAFFLEDVFDTAAAAVGAEGEGALRGAVN
ncbi:MAG: hypothetical protein ACKVPY_06530 [Paracoccaceae bacterium]